MTVPNSSALRALSQELKSLKDEPLEGFRLKLVNEDNLFDWEVAIFGPPQTIYEGGYFKARIHFPQDYPFSPPTIRFDKSTLLFHPNVYESGDLCISILHPPINDPHSGELPCERWNPTQSVRTILLSVVSLLNEPNTSSPANVDASVMYRRWKESNGLDDQYEILVKQQVAASRIEADKDGITVPTTLEDYVVKLPSSSRTKSSFDMSFYEDDDDYDNMDDTTDLNESGEMVSSIEDASSVGDDDQIMAPGSPRSASKGGESFEEEYVIAMSDDEDNEEVIVPNNNNANGDTATEATPPKYSYKFKIQLNKQV